MDTQLTTAIWGFLSGGTVLGIVTLVVNKAQRKASIYETMQKTTTQHIKELNDDLESKRTTIERLEKEKNDIFELYKECLSMKESFTARIHDLELEVQKLRNELIKATLFKN